VEFPVAYGKYHLLERIAIGGMAEVFLAKSFGVAGFERLLVIKRILPHMAEDREFIDMFVDEARIASTLSHSGIAQILELGQEEAAYFIAMEFIHGKDLGRLQDRLQKRRRVMPIPLSVLVVSRLCEALEYAHRKTDSAGNSLRIIHRDVSPGNVLISYDGDVKLIDFGIAKAQNRMGRTNAGTLKGKFGYMSPEQVRGLPLDHRSDIFAAGIILYELLTGERLFAGESDFGTLEKVRNATVTPPSTYNRRIPRELEQVVMRALAREPEERYEWASDLQQDLARYLMFEGSLTTTKSLAAFMKEIFSEDLARENEKLLVYRQRGYPLVGAPSTTTDRMPAEEDKPPERPRAKVSQPPAAATIEIAEELATPVRTARDAPPPDLSDETERKPAEDEPAQAAVAQSVSRLWIAAGEKPKRGRTGTEFVGRKPLATPEKRPASSARTAPTPRSRGRPVMGIVATVLLIAAAAVGIALVIPGGAPAPSVPRPAPIASPEPVSPSAPDGSPVEDGGVETAAPVADFGPGEMGGAEQEPAASLDAAILPEADKSPAAAASGPASKPTGPPPPKAPDGASSPKPPSGSPPAQPAQPVRPPATVAHAVRAKVLVVSEPPGAEILLNGRAVGETPRIIEDVDPNRPTFLILKKSGFRKFIQKVQFEGKPEIEIQARLVAEPDAVEAGKTPPAKPTAGAENENVGFLVANTKPWARVIVDGKDTGRWTPIPANNPIRLPAGKHRITFVTEDGRKIESQVEIRPGENTKIIQEFK